MVKQTFVAVGAKVSLPNRGIPDDEEDFDYGMLEIAKRTKGRIISHESYNIGSEQYLKQCLDGVDPRATPFLYLKKPYEGGYVIRIVPEAERGKTEKELREQILPRVLDSIPIDINSETIKPLNETEQHILDAWVEVKKTEPSYVSRMANRIKKVIRND